MAQFATSEALEARLGVEFNSVEEGRADTLLELASGLIVDETGQQFELVEDDVLERRGTSDDRITLPGRPVVSVASVVLDSAALVEDQDWYRDGDTLVALRTVRPPGYVGGFGYPWQELVVTYTHGYETVPPIVRGVCLEMVVRIWVNPGSVEREGYGPEQVGYAERGLLLTDSEKQALRRLLTGRNGTVKLR